MELGAWLTWLAVALQFLAAGAVVIWPEHKWIGLVLLSIGLLLAVISGWVFLSTNYSKRIDELKGFWFLFPIGLTVGLFLAWFALKLYPVPIVPDFRKWQTEKNEVISRKTYRNEVVDVDGKTFDHCMFFNTTLYYHGTGNVTFLDSQFTGMTYIKTDNIAVKGFLVLQAFIKNQPHINRYMLGEVDPQGNVRIIEEMTKTPDKPLDDKAK